MFQHPRPTIIRLREDVDAGVRVAPVRNPLPHGTLGDLGLASRVSGPPQFSSVLLIVGFDPAAIKGLDPDSLRMFRFEGRAFRPHWNSGVNVALNFVWAKVERPGVYLPIGVPRDRLLQAALFEGARRRAYNPAASAEEARSLTRAVLEPFLEFPIEQLEEIRGILTRAEAQTAIGIPLQDRRPGRGGHLEPFPLPGDATLRDFRKRIEALTPSIHGLPEEVLLTPPEEAIDPDLPWAVRPGVPPPDEWISEEVLDRFEEPVVAWFHRWFPWFRSKDWWMHQHDRRHSGHASGWSPIRSTSVGRLVLQSVVPVDGPVITKPSIVAGKVYVGSGRLYGGPGGTMYKINLFTGAKEGELPAPGVPFYSWYQGIGGSPAIVDAKIYFTGVHGKVYCVDATTMTPGGVPHPPPLWVTDLKNANATHKQPVNQPDADCWTGPLGPSGE